MGTRNFGPGGDYIDLYYEIDTDGLLEDPETIEAVREYLDLSDEDEVPEDAIYDYINREIRWWQEDAERDAEKLLGKYDFSYFTLSLEYGYYEGMRIIITTEYEDVLESEDEKAEMYEEIATIGELLTEFAELGWRSSSDFNGTCEDIADSMQAMIRDVDDLEVDDYDEPKNEPEDWDPDEDEE